MPLFFHLAINYRPRMIRNSALVTAAVLILAYAAHAEVVNWRSCPAPTTNDAPDSSNCDIHEVRVDPCREASERKPCVLKKGHNASISFDYTAKFSDDMLSSRAYWVSEIMDLPFLGMPINACESTVCPVVPNVRQVYTVDLPISKKFPSRTYNLKWKLWSTSNSEQECCFMFDIKLVK